MTCLSFARGHQVFYALRPFMIALAALPCIAILFAMAAIADLLDRQHRQIDIRA